MKVLFATPEIPWPLASGAALRRWNMLQGLKGTASVDAVVLRNLEPAHASAFEGCERLLELPGGLPGETERRLYRSTVGRGLLTITSPLPREFRPRGPGRLRRALRTWLSGQRYDLIWIETVQMAMVLGPHRGIPTVLDGDDFNYVRNLALLRGSPPYGAKFWDYLDVAKSWYWERSLAKRFTFVARCSEEDRALHPADNIVVIPNGATVPAAVRRMPERRALFVGLLAYPPNAHGLRWYLDEVWPIVRSRVPDARLDVVGRGPPANIRDAHGRDGVAVHGFVEDLSPFYERAAVAIVPLWAGGGTRIKILESLARSLPVVSTQVGAYGIPAAESEGLQRADSAAEFAARCATLLADPHAKGHERAVAGREWVRRRYDWRIIQQQVASLALGAAAARGVLRDGRSLNPARRVES